MFRIIRPSLFAAFMPFINVFFYPIRRKSYFIGQHAKNLAETIEQFLLDKNKNYEAQFTKYKI
jgi:hypothetical protein